ncbi:hypothetical protein [Marinococcus halophilus]|uniref:hypothetical protein n=1 Tax=Marinococcus halophilus TaxID=1371 RepID=UPI0009A8BB13|nr:hypothetical protein [Marinococcus halophilus]
MKNVWLLRPLPNGTNQLHNFLEYDFIAIGYPVGKSLNSLSYEKVKKELARFDMDEGATNVYNFISQMKIDDLVIVPDDNSRDVYFCTVTSQYIYVPNVDNQKKGLGYPHQKTVNWFFNKEPLNRNDFSKELQASLRSPKTITDLTHHLDVLNEIIFDVAFISGGVLKGKAIETVREMLEEDQTVDTRLRAAELALKYDL